LDTLNMLRTMRGMLENVNQDRTGLTAGQRLEVVEEATHVFRLTEGLYLTLLGEADKAGASLKATGTPSQGWLARNGDISRREASALVHKAADVAGNPLVRDAVLVSAALEFWSFSAVEK
jgi:hypothetical protein